MADESYHGYAGVQQQVGDFNQLSFLVQQHLAGVATATLATVIKVTNMGEAAPVGLVDIQPLVSQVDGKGTGTPHGTIHNVPYFRLQGGTNAVIMDPIVGDIGIAIFAREDISTVKATKAASLPGSRRRFSMADAMYLGGLLNGTPLQYVRFSADGIEIKAPLITLTGDVECTGTITAAVDVVADGISLVEHMHDGVEPGGGTSGPPVG